MSIYADSSFFVSHYLQDSHGAEVERRMALLPRIWFTQLQRVELIHAIHQHVFRGFISSRDALSVFADVDQDCVSGVWILAQQPDGTFNRCERLAHRHVATLGVRTLDSLHVATALELGAARFWTFDQRQARLAEAEGRLPTELLVKNLAWGDNSTNGVATRQDDAAMIDLRWWGVRRVGIGEQTSSAGWAHRRLRG